MSIVVFIVLILTLTICFLYIASVINANAKENKGKIKAYVILILLTATIFYFSVEFIYPRDFQDKVIVGKNISISELAKDNHYYISYNETKLKCTKEQYDFLVNGSESYIYGRLNFFNRKTGEILKVDDKPI